MPNAIWSISDLPDPGDETTANLYSSTGEPPAVAAETHVTVRNVVPEPTTGLMLILGMAAMMFRRASEVS